MDHIHASENLSKQRCSKTLTMTTAATWLDAFEGSKTNTAIFSGPGGANSPACECVRTITFELNDR